MNTRVASANLDKSSGGVSAGTDRFKILVLLTTVNVLLTLDRSIPQMVVEPMRMELDLSDGQIGMVLGVAFGVSFGISGVLVGPFIDRVNRVRFLSAITVVWSGMTFMTGLSWNYITLLFARAGLGASEAGGMPAALNLLGDSFPANRRSTAVGVFKMGVPLGIFFASVIVAQLATDYGWRVCFFVAGLPGFLVAILLVAFVKEPQRGVMEGKAQQASNIKYRELFSFILNDIRLTLFIIGYMLAILFSSAFAGFVAAFLQRYHDLTLEQIGFYYGLGSLLSIVSPVIIGMLADRVVDKTKIGIFYFLAILVALIAVFAVNTILLTHLTFVLTSFVVWQFLAYGLAAPSLSAIITLSPVAMRGSILALVGVANMCIGYGTGPVIVGFLSDFIESEQSLRIALGVVVISASFISVLLILYTARKVKQLWVD